MNKWMKYTILFLVVFKVISSGILLNRDNVNFSSDLVVDVVSAQEKIEPDLGKTLNRTFSEEEIAILTSLEKKRLELSLKEERLNIQEERLGKLRQDVEDRILELKNIESKIEILLETQEAIAEERLNHLAKVYEATPPEQAGPMMSKLDVKLAAKIIMRISGRKAGKIWAFVEPKQAVKISEELARKRTKVIIPSNQKKMKGA